MRENSWTDPMVDSLGRRRSLTETEEGNTKNREDGKVEFRTGEAVAVSSPKGRKQSR